jgi:chromate transporter
VSQALVQLALLLARLSLLAFGNGNSVLAELQRQVVAHGWMSAHQFADAYALSQIAPGPGPLMVFFVGFTMAGLPGALLAVAAFFFPPALLALFMTGIWGRWQHAPLAASLRTAILPVSLGLVGALAVSLGRTVATWPLLLLVAASAFLSWRFRKLPPGLVILGCAAIGGLLLRP